MPKPLSAVGYADRSDADLATQAAAGDPSAFAAIMRRHNRALFRTARAACCAKGSQPRQTLQRPRHSHSPASAATAWSRM